MRSCDCSQSSWPCCFPASPGPGVQWLQTAPSRQCVQRVAQGPWRQPFPVDVRGPAMLSSVQAPDLYVRCLWKPQGTVTRVHTGQAMMSIHTRLQNKEHVIEALCKTRSSSLAARRSISPRWGLAKFNVDEFENMVAEKRLLNGCGVRYIPNRGPLDKWWALHSYKSLGAAPPYSCSPINPCFPVKEMQKAASAVPSLPIYCSVSSVNCGDIHSKVTSKHQHL